jgi:dienelactone hydrolase
MNRRNALKSGLAVPVSLLCGAQALSAKNEEAVPGGPTENPFPPKKIVLAKPASYSPLTYLNQVVAAAKPRLAFRGTTLSEATKWKETVRNRLWKLLGETEAQPAVAPSAKLLETKSKGDYAREKWVLDVIPGRSMPFYVLRPKAASAPLKTVLCLHGHGSGAHDVINEPVDDNDRALIKAVNYDYAVQSVKRGWCAIAPDLFAFGERVDYVEDARPGPDGGCEKPSLNAFLLGKTLAGIRVKDVQALIDWVSSQKDFDLDHLACMGLSGGGMMTMYTAALDERIHRALIAGYLCEAASSILPIRHCSCNFVPDLYRWMDFPEITSLIAPRLLIVQSGRKDAIFPIESVRRAYHKVEGVYRVYGAEKNLHLHEHDGFHSFHSSSLDVFFGA